MLRARPRACYPRARDRPLRAAPHSFSTYLRRIRTDGRRRRRHRRGRAAGNGNDTCPQVGVIAQYVKDLSFENPNAPAVYQWQSQPQIDVQFNIGAQHVGEDVHEVALKIEIAAKAPRADRLHASSCSMPACSRSATCPTSSSSPSCSPRRRASSSRSPAGSSPTRSQRRRLPAAAARPDRLRRLYMQRAAQAAGGGERRARPGT